MTFVRFLGTWLERQDFKSHSEGRMKQISAHITDACNSKCSFCVVGSPLIRHDTVNYDEIVAFLSENASNGYQSVNLHGGEPTIHPRLFELLSTIAALGYPEVHIQTNGRRMKDMDFTERLAKHGVRVVVISLHGATAGTQDSLAQAPGGFEETLEGIRNAKRVGLYVRTNTVVTTKNLEELEAILQLLQDLQVDHVNISCLHPVGSGFFAFDTVIPSVAQTRERLLPAIERLVSRKMPLSLEGFPFCVITPYERLAIEYEKREIRMLYQRRVFDNYDYFMDTSCRTQGPPCQNCRYRTSCGGVYQEYIDQRGWSEFTTVPRDEPVIVRMVCKTVPPSPFRTF